MIKIKDFNTEIKNNVQEVTIKEYEEVLSEMIYNINNTITQKWLNVISILGGNDIIDLIDIDALVNIVSELDFSDDNLPIKEIEINGTVYESYSGEYFKFKAKDFALIEKSILTDKNRSLSYMCAILYKDKNLNKDLNYNNDIIMEKVKLFETLPCYYILPYITILSDKILNNFNMIDYQNKLTKNN